MPLQAIASGTRLDFRNASPGDWLEETVLVGRTGRHIYTTSAKPVADFNGGSQTKVSGGDTEAILEASRRVEFAERTRNDPPSSPTTNGTNIPPARTPMATVQPATTLKLSALRSAMSV
ncbi:hypothetical protein D9611_009924 [Ephemerocybe angulata]|uniref:Uncharacterized protein n=1 Tax=Ephemerocybe angulata TaxID=980116 RepID=A0A8H5C442_9AGAR|nr:hypothetical protein D9611_009924 [Tulosesus angulatus]